MTPEQLEILERWIKSIIAAKMANSMTGVLYAEQVERETRAELEKALKR